MNRVLLIGATSAIASEMARLYAARGDALYLLARNPERLAALARELGSATRGSRAADLDRTEDCAGHVEAAIECLGGLDIAVIAHGLLGDQRQSEVDHRVAEQGFRTNLLSAVSLLISLANHFETTGPRERPGHIALLSSVAGDRGRPRNYSYGSAKAALNVYLQGVRSRLYPTGTKVHTFKLGPVDTPMTVDHVKNASFARADAVARRLVDAIDRGAQEVYVPSFWRPVMSAVRWLPEALFQRLRFLSGR